MIPVRGVNISHDSMAFCQSSRELFINFLYGISSELSINSEIVSSINAVLSPITKCIIIFLMQFFTILIIVYNMSFIKLMLFIVFITVPTYSQTLFEESLSNSKPISVTNLSKNKQTIAKSSEFRMISTNLESVIIRGDIHLLYEIPQSKSWSAMIFAHLNPQGTFNGETGDMGVLGGGRMYLDKLSPSMPVFLQGMLGFNHYSSWDLFISVEFGQRIKWMDSIFLDLSVVINRSYSNEALDPMAYLKANLSFKLDRPILPFL